jgi:hypothetical protein
VLGHPDPHGPNTPITQTVHCTRVFSFLLTSRFFQLGNDDPLTEFYGHPLLPFFISCLLSFVYCFVPRLGAMLCRRQRSLAYSAGIFFLAKHKGSKRISLELNQIKRTLFMVISSISKTFCGRLSLDLITGQPGDGNMKGVEYRWAYTSEAQKPILCF